jgi:hypothetical protein
MKPIINFLEFLFGYVSAAAERFAKATSMPFNIFLNLSRPKKALLCLPLLFAFLLIASITIIFLLLTITLYLMRLVPVLLFKNKYLLIAFTLAPIRVIKDHFPDFFDASIDSTEVNPFKKYTKAQEGMIINLILLSPSKFGEILDSSKDFPPSHPIFSGDILPPILEFIWLSQIRRNFFREAFAYGLMLIIITINVLVIFPYRSYSQLCESFTDDEITSIAVDSFIAFMLLIRYISEMRHSLKSDLEAYLNNLWNKVDFFLILLGCYTLGLDLSFIIDKESHQVREPSIMLKCFLSAFLFICWLRMLEFARGFQTTATLIKLLIRVGKDMFGFLIVLFYMIIAFAISG